MPSAKSTRRRQHYPFAAIIGQDDLKLCLILCAIDPSIGGVLIQGDKGTAKSTAARGISHLMPQIEVGYASTSRASDPYNRSPSEEAEEGDAVHSESRFIDTPFVDLPIGSTEDRVVGSLDFSASLKHGGKRVFAPGLLASANRGVLYVDEVNLLPAHLVDVLLDAAASGVNTVQREGLTISHPARFMLIGTMNPEEGDLRPQLLDRFGLMVNVAAPQDAAERSEVVRQRINFERDETSFREKWNDAEEELTKRIAEAKDRLSDVVLSDESLLLISRICTEFQVGSLRADITMYKTATALAAWKGRLAVEAEDIRQAAQWVLAHRRRRQPFEQPMGGPQANDMLNQIMNDSGDNLSQQPPTEQDEMDGNEPANDTNRQETPNDPSSADKNKNDPSKREKGNGNSDDNNDSEMQTFTASKPGQIKQLRLGTQQLKNAQQPGSGRRNPIHDTKRKGHYVRSMQTDKPVDLALDATLRAAAVNGLSESGQPIIHPENWRRKVRNSTSDTLILFVVDASGSMSARKGMETVKGAVLALLTDAYQQRDRVGVIAFRGVKAEVLLEPTKSVDLAEKQLQRLPTGGRTPLAHALSLTNDTICRLRRNEPDQSVLLIVLSDGKANVPLPNSDAGADAWNQTEQVAGQLAKLELPTLMLDTDSGGLVRVGRGKELAHLLKADYMELDDLSSDGLIHTIRQAVG